jgi:hypothetical protein
MVEPDLVPESKLSVSTLVILDHLTEVSLTVTSSFALPFEVPTVHEPAELMTEPTIRMLAPDDEEADVWTTVLRQPVVMAARRKRVRKARITASLPRISPC